VILEFLRKQLLHQSSQTFLSISLKLAIWQNSAAPSANTTKDKNNPIISKSDTLFLDEVTEAKTENFFLSKLYVQLCCKIEQHVPLLPSHFRSELEKKQKKLFSQNRTPKKRSFNFPRNQI